MLTKLTAILLSLACGALLFAAPGESPFLNFGNAYCAGRIGGK